MGVHFDARRPSRGAEGPADGAQLRRREDALVAAGVAIYALFPVAAVALLGLGDPCGTPTETVLARLCLAHVLTGAGAVLALLVRLFCFLIEAIG